MQGDIKKGRDGLATLDQGDYQLLNAEMAKITALESDVDALELRWLELSELLN